MEYKDFTCENFIKKVASKDPTPGGGGVAAYVASLGAALQSMVANLTIGKKKYQEVEEEIIELKKKVTCLQEEFLVLMDRDAVLFEPLAKAYQMPKETKEQQEEKENVMEQALKTACEVPLVIMQKSIETMEIGMVLLQKGSKLATSDAGEGILLCEAALKSASLNVWINTKLMKDREEANKKNEQVDHLLKQGEELAGQAFRQVKQILKNQ